MEAKKILIPTDFTTQSLELVQQTLEASSDRPLQIVLVHGCYPSLSITDMLFFSKTRIINQLQSEDFVEACKVLKNKYDSKLNSLTVDIITSNNESYFKNYLEGNKITHTIVPNEGFLNFKKVQGIDTIALLKNCGLPCQIVNFENQTENLNNYSKRSLANVLLSNLK
ncbi:hypothetical protein D1013_03470 [Euzebyella marina]|uniref:Universal stress protein n=1 Tax=Euzebyella marina TaxID=1761453 RepID=A0A3G2L2P1_9FLAO|nr:hypothetical protein [Euzebyella marina]AYN66508.1 hypothetical protein D1013_03470 [Euzebyella marina]MBG47559.1 hypothetical protein [Pseudozobellia sp.]|tara:strand:- start:155 stop:658 length:504 start_codon:yes stop_codon:yes gene_type:complete